MSFGNDQHVRRSLRIDVFENEYLVVFVDFCRRNLTCNDFAEKAVCFHEQMLTDNAYSVCKTVLMVRSSYHGDQDFNQRTGGAAHLGSPPAWTPAGRFARRQRRGGTDCFDPAQETKDQRKDRDRSGYRIPCPDIGPG